MFDFKDKRVLITGAGAGIGAAAARAFAKEGARLGLNSVSPSARQVVKELTQAGRQALFLPADVSRSDQVKDMVKQMEKTFGGIDIVVNCAGIVSGGSVEETDEETWNRTMAVNVTGIFLVCKYTLPSLRRSRGVIVNISSLAAVKGLVQRAAYSASKGAVLSLSRAMAADYIKEGVRVNCVSPGTVLSPSLESRIASEADPAAAYRRFVSRQAAGRLGRPEEIAAAVLFCAASETEFMNGANIMIDGAASL